MLVKQVEGCVGGAEMSAENCFILEGSVWFFGCLPQGGNPPTPSLVNCRKQISVLKLWTELEIWTVAVNTRFGFIIPSVHNSLFNSLLPHEHATIIYARKKLSMFLKRHICTRKLNSILELPVKAILLSYFYFWNRRVLLYSSGYTLVPYLPALGS